MGSQEEQDEHIEEEKVEDVKLKEDVKEEIDGGDGDVEEMDIEVRSSSPPAVWSKKAV